MEGGSSNSSILGDSLSWPHDEPTLGTILTDNLRLPIVPSLHCLPPILHECAVQNIPELPNVVCVSHKSDLVCFECTVLNCSGSSPECFAFSR